MVDKTFPRLRLLAAAAAACLFGPGPVRAEPRIEWEVVNRFPLFSDAAQFRAIADVFDALPADKRRADPALNLEIELERRALGKTLGPAFDNADALARFGWSSAVVRKTCFDPGSSSYAGCKTQSGETYRTMSRTDLSARLVDGPAGGACVWSVNGVQALTAPCDDAPVTLPGAPISGPLEIAVAADGAPVASTSGESVRTLTIVGLGDSFASGEGNPDRPAAFDDRPDLYGRSSVARRVIDRAGHTPIFLGPRDFQSYPLRIGASPQRFGSRKAEPVWFNTQCHRSLYSHQLKAALQLAVENKHLLVKYFAYACTGAEIYEGVLGNFDGRDGADHPDSGPQLVKLLRDHCPSGAPYVFRDGAPRVADWNTVRPCRQAGERIDAMLLSIGGNDIGFARVIANEFFHPSYGNGPLVKARFKLWKDAADPIGFEEARHRLDVLAGRFADLKVALETKAGLEGGKIVQLGYPQIAASSPTDTCGIGRDGMDVHQILGIRSQGTGSGAKDMVTRLNERISREAKWPLLLDHVAKFDGHALCSAGMAEGFDGPDGMRFPDIVEGRWRPFRPSIWQPYTPRARWFVTPNDSFLAGNFMSLRQPLRAGVRDILQPLIAANYGGAFHPNALGHAAMADTLAVELRKRFGLAAPDAPPVTPP